jgi:hypothetical protein
LRFGTSITFCSLAVLDLDLDEDLDINNDLDLDEDRDLARFLSVDAGIT